MANSTLTKGSTVEVTINEPGFIGAWYVATLLDEVGYSPSRKKQSNKKEKKTGYLVKYDTLLDEGDVFKPLTEVVDPLFVRPVPPRNIRRYNATDGEGGGEFEVHDFVDAYHREGWWIGVVKSVIINDGETTAYVVLFENPTEEFEFDKSKVRLHVDWVDCRWVIPPKKAPEKLLGNRNGTNNALSGFTTPSKGAQITETVGPSRYAKKSSRSRERPESKTAVDSSCGKRFQQKKFQPSTGSKGKTDVIVLDDIHLDTPPVEHEIIIKQTHEPENGTSHQKRKRRTPPKSVVKKPIGLLEGTSRLSPQDHQGNSLNHATNGTTTDYQQDWPFIKRSQIWDTIELYSQKPHFAPMKDIKEDYREGLAIAHIVTFGNLVQGLSDLKPNDPVDMFNNSLETLCELETHGFDVGRIRGRLNQLLSLKTKVCEQENTREEVVKEVEKCNHEKCLVEKEMDELKEKMQVLKSKSEQIASMLKVKEDELVRLQSNDLELDFEILAATPL